MKRFLTFLFLTCILTAPTLSQAYFGGNLGLIHDEEDKFGYGLNFGIGLPFNLGIDAQINGFVATDTVATGTADKYWFQTNLDLSYDLNFLWKKVSEKIELHPYIKGGFTYGAAVLDTSGTDSKASHGPGYNFGGGVDWKILPFMTIGFDVTEAFIELDGVTVTISGVSVPLAPDRTAKVFSAMGTIKFFAY